MKKTYRIKTNNQELLIRKQNESDATSRWIELQKIRPRRDKDWKCEFIDLLTMTLHTLYFLKLVPASWSTSHRLVIQRNVYKSLACDSRSSPQDNSILFLLMRDWTWRLRLNSGVFPGPINLMKRRPRKGSPKNQPLLRTHFSSVSNRCRQPRSSIDSVIARGCRTSGGIGREVHGSTVAVTRSFPISSSNR